MATSYATNRINDPAAQTQQIVVPPYEVQLNADGRWALAEGDRYFEEKSAIQDTLHRIVQRLDKLDIPYVVSGGLALFAHGYRRFTEIVDLLVPAEGLDRLHRELERLG